MTLADTVKQDLVSAMRSGEKDRVGALRLVLSELQKAAKEGGDDELAVLRRERKRRLDAAAQRRDAGRDDLVAGEEAEAELIGGYLPAELSDDDLRRVLGEAAEAMRAPRSVRLVYRRGGLPCRRCGTGIEARRQGEEARAAYWCPACQPPSRPLAHGAEAGTTEGAA